MNGRGHCDEVFELWQVLRVPWTARRSNQSILNEISPEYSLKGLILTLKLQYFGHLMRRTDSLEKTLFWEILKIGEGDNRGWDGWMLSPIQWTWVWASSGRRWSLVCCSVWGHRESAPRVTEQLLLSKDMQGEMYYNSTLKFLPIKLHLGFSFSSKSAWHSLIWG